MKLLFSSTVIVILASMSLGAQNINDYNVKNANSNIIDYSDRLNIYIYTKQKISTFGFYDSVINRQIIYSPNGQTNLGVGFNYKFIGIGFAFNFNFINNDDDIYGHTRRLDWQANLYSNKSIIDLTFHRYSSHYVENPTNVFPDFKDGDPNYIRPDIKNFGVGFSYFHILNHERFSYKAAFVLTAIQKKSAGSVFFGGGMLYGAVSGDSSFFPTNSYFNDSPPIVSVKSFSLGISGGYAYTFIIKKNFYLSLSLGLSLNGGSQKEKLESGEKQSKGLFFVAAQPRIATGFNKKKWFAGISAVSSINSFENPNNTSRITMKYNYGNFKVFIGMRFNLKKD